MIANGTDQVEGARTSVRAPGRRDGRGAAAVETAAVMPVLVVVTLVGVWLLSLPVTQVRVVDAAREGARAAARSETPEAALAAARRVAPHGASVSVHQQGDLVVVHVAAKAVVPVTHWGLLPATVEATATALREDR